VLSALGLSTLEFLLIGVNIQFVLVGLNDRLVYTSAIETLLDSDAD
jgi:hypothetical protein